MMAEVVIMPKLGFNMDEGQLVKWCKNIGDAVTKGEVLFEINTDKTTMPVEATMDGVLLKIMLKEGAFAAVFTPIAVVGWQGEDPDAVQASCSTVPVTPVAVAAVDVKASDLKFTPKAKKLVKDEGIDPASLSSIQGTGFRGGITARDIKASPLAHKLAACASVDLASVQGTGLGGKIMKADIVAALAVTGMEEKKIRLVTSYKGVRKTIGERLAQSMSNAPHVYFTTSVDTSNLTALRAQLNASGEDKIAVSDLLIMGVSRTLQQYPDVNASLVGAEIVCYTSINIGIAVGGDSGLIVPVVKNVQEKSLTLIAKETRDLVKRAKLGHLTPSECAAGTFTISNLGPFGVDNFTAIVNPPESAILAVSAIKKTPVVEMDAAGNDMVVIRPVMNIQLSVDHRLIDGLLAAKFIKYFKELLENPFRILM